MRSAEVEEILGQLSDPFESASATHGVLANADLLFKPASREGSDAQQVPVTQGTIESHVTSPDRELRRTAWESYADAHIALKNTMALCLATGVKQHIFRARARRYGSALVASLERNFVPTRIYHNVVETFRRNLPIWHRYWQLRRKLLGYDRLRAYDLRAPLTAAKPVVTYQQAMDWVCEGLEVLGDDYGSVLQNGLAHERWVDVYPNAGKAAGAFSTGSPGTHPFVLMSYSDDVFGLSTLAHELGHSMHSYMSWKHQPLVYASYSIFVAEVASNLSQALVRDYVLRTSSDSSLKIALIEEAMANFYRYFFLMPTLARFELAIHERVEMGSALTADGMSALLLELFEEGFGGEVEVDAERVGITWAQFHTHLYHDFYVYQYTTGIAGAYALADRVRKREPDAVENYMAFLKSGSSLYPLQALQLAGVDLATPGPIQSAFDHLSGLVDQLGALLGA